VFLAGDGLRVRPNGVIKMSLFGICYHYLRQNTVRYCKFYLGETGQRRNEENSCTVNSLFLGTSGICLEIAVTYGVCKGSILGKKIFSCSVAAENVPYRLFEAILLCLSHHILYSMATLNRGRQGSDLWALTALAKFFFMTP